MGNELRILTADEARTLREAATPGPWDTRDAEGSTVDANVVSNLLPSLGGGVAIATVDTDEDAEAVAATPDALHTVEVLWDRLAEAERRIKELEVKAKNYDLLVAPVHLIGRTPRPGPLLVEPMPDGARLVYDKDPDLTAMVTGAVDGSDHEYVEVTYDRDDNPIPPTCAYCGRTKDYCKGCKA